MLRHFVVVGIVLLNLAGCSSMNAPGRSTTPAASPETFAHRVATSEVVLLWNCLESAPGVLRMEGIGQNPWQAQPIQYLEFELVGVDAQERTTARTTGAARDFQLMTNQSTPFQLDLKTTGTEVRVDLYYHYRFHEEFDMGALLGALVAGPPMAGPRLLAQTQTFRVWDACGATQHLAR
jgi:hypothetical protein